jgi:hypothetical protein
MASVIVDVEAGGKRKRRLWPALLFLAACGLLVGVILWAV